MSANESNAERVLASGTRIYLQGDGVVRVVPAVDALETVQSTEELLTAGRELLAGRPAPLLYDCRPMRSMTADARKRFISEGAEFITALALIMSSAANRLATNAALRVIRPPVPVRVFGDQKSALRWLDSHR